MSREEEFKKYKKAADNLSKDISKDKAKAREFLINVGILTKGGNLKPQFKKLCTPGKLA